MFTQLRIAVVVLLAGMAASMSYRWSIFRDDNIDLCDKDLLCRGQPSTMCLDTKHHPDEAKCSNYTKVRWNFQNRKVIINAHNGLRNRVANGVQPASNMNYLHWDKDLELMAEKWVAQCVVDHDYCRFIYNSSYPIGQNIQFLFGIQKIGWEARIIRDWFMEYYNDFTDEQIERLSTTEYDHYVQLVWAKTEFVGCAAAKFDEGYFMVCNYFPRGNIQGESIYKIGPACSDCPLDRSSCSLTFDGLCGLDDMYSNAATAQLHWLLAFWAIAITLLTYTQFPVAADF